MDITIVTELNEKQIQELHELYQHEWFTQGRTIEDVKEMLKYTDFVFGFCKPGSEELIGFARVISDCVYKAFVFDVIITEKYRGKGLGKKIMTAIFNHPVLSKVSHIELYCPEKLTKFYEKMGFERRTSLLLRRNSIC